MRRILQTSGCEIIHLGHDRSVDEVVNCAIEEDAQAIAMTSYQGGHMEYFKYMKDLLDERGAGTFAFSAAAAAPSFPRKSRNSRTTALSAFTTPTTAAKWAFKA